MNQVAERVKGKCCACGVDVGPNATSCSTRCYQRYWREVQHAKHADRDRERSRRKYDVRSRTFSPRDNAAPIRHLMVVNYPADVQRPRTRGECAGVPRPCPFVSCRYHLYLETVDSGSLKINFPDREVCDMEHSCALDLADSGAKSLEAIAQAMNLTRERVRQLEERAMKRAEENPDFRKLVNP